MKCETCGNFGTKLRVDKGRRSYLALYLSLQVTVLYTSLIISEYPFKVALHSVKQFFIKQQSIQFNKISQRNFFMTITQQ